LFLFYRAKDLFVILIKACFKRTIAQRLFQLKGWQVRKRRSVEPDPGCRHYLRWPRANERWAADIARVWCVPVHRWCALTIVMDCRTRAALGWRLSPSGNAKAAGAALEESLISRYGTLGRTQDLITLRSDNGLVFTSRRYTRTVYQYGLKQKFIRPHTPQQNGMIE